MIGKDSLIGRWRGLLLSYFAAALLAGCAATGSAPVVDGAAGRAADGGAAAAGPRAGHYIVKQGDTLAAIARQTGVSTQDLSAWNRLADPNQLAVGQELRVAPPGGTQVRPIAADSQVEVHPIGTEQPLVAPTAPAAPAAAGPTLKTEPLGGKLPYSEQALAQVRDAAQGGVAPAAPSAAAPSPAPAPAAPATPAVRMDSPWIWPVSGKLLASFNEGSSKGIDIGGNPGDPVIASAAGKVVYSGTGLRGYGKLVIIKHDDDFLTAYAHNRELFVNEGQSVAKGQKIAELGSTDSDRPMLHFEIRRQGKPVNPLKYLPNR
jgi:lipoprotein NlpD